MSRYLIVEIDDNEVAGDLAQSIIDGRELYFYSKQEPTNTGDDTWRVQKVIAKVVGLFGKPTKFCECPTPGIPVKGAKLGWFVCGTCKMARPGWQYPSNLLQPPEASRIEFVRKQMVRPGFVEGLERNPEEAWAESSRKGNPKFQGKR